jgi:hypothetical protein
VCAKHARREADELVIMGAEQPLECAPVSRAEAVGPCGVVRDCGERF